MIFYDGPSTYDSAPIIGILTFGSANSKTGDMIQSFILRKDIAPDLAVQKDNGADSSVCGKCPHRWHLNGICYVLVFQSPLSVFKAYHRGSYGQVNPAKLTGRKLRMGTYGDPLAVPAGAWERLLASGIKGHTGYTHGMTMPAHVDKSAANFMQVSVDNPQQALKFQKQGYKTFRVMPQDGDLLPSEKLCPANGGTITCETCLACDGKTANIAIYAHGARAGKFKQANRADIIALA